MNKEQALKVAKTALYVGISAVLAFLIGWVQGNQELFGIYAPVINVILVTLKQLFTTPDSEKY
jgi:hypothetical protein